MSKYQFTFDAMTIGDLLTLIDASEKANTGLFFSVLHRLTVGGAYSLPYKEMPDVVQQFTTAFVAHMKDTGGPTPPDVARILRQALEDKDT